MGYKAAAQILKDAEDLKAKVLVKSDLLNDGNIWTNQQKLQNAYYKVLVTDLEYALDKKVEQDLWNIGFKNYISALQEMARDKKNIRRSEYQVLLTYSLEAASGFYLTLLHELCNTFDIDLPFHKKGVIYGQMPTNTDQVTLPQTSSCLYICQYCMVHLGDIARYRNQRRQAESFYKQAIMISPTSGHPYNQLALLQATQSDKLSTVFYYVRGIAVKNPFPAATTNLMNTLSSLIDKESISDNIQTKMNSSEFIHLFLCTQGYLHTLTELPQAEQTVKSLNSIMTALVATQSFSKTALIKMTVINLYTLYRLTGSKASKSENLTEDEILAKNLVLELLAGSISAFLVPVHTFKADDTMLDYYVLPAVKLLFYFIQNDPEILKDKVFTSRLQIWPSFCKFLNNVQKYLKTLNYAKYSNIPLPEDKMLQGFILLSKYWKEYDFKEDIEDPKIERLVRVKRIYDFSLWLTEQSVNGNKLILKTEVNGEWQFEPGCLQPDPTNDLLEEMKSFNVEESSEGSKKGSEKKTGILKPQGSLEKSREERELLSDQDSNGSLSLKAETKTKRAKQNVALQSIFKKMEENKQVKFNVEELEKDKEKGVKFDAIATKPQVAQQPYTLPLRTQSFNQNHPAFPANQADYRNPVDNFKSFEFSKGEASFANKNVGFNKPPQSSLPPGGFNPQMHSYQGPFSPNHNFKNWKKEEGTSTWWPNSSPNPQNYQSQDNFGNYPYPGGFFPSNQMLPKPDFSKPPPRNLPGDVFNPQWGAFPRNNFMGDGYDKANQHSLSMRQAMLKEANLPGSPSPSLTRMPNMPNAGNKFNLNSPTQPQDYSLFNANSWTPNLMGQLRNPKIGSESTIGHMPQQSLFGGQGPQSLAQLLEQQNQLPKNDL